MVCTEQTPKQRLMQEPLGMCEKPQSSQPSSKSLLAEMAPLRGWDCSQMWLELAAVSLSPPG